MTELLKSFTLYGTVFTTSCLLIYIGLKGQKQLIPSWCIFLIALLIPSVIAGLRSEIVGTDVKVYVAPTYYEMSNIKSIDEMEVNNLSIGISNTGNIEVGFVYLAYFANKYLGHIGFFFGLIAFIQSLFIFLSLYSYRKNIPIYFGMFLYYSFYFLDFGFNTIRQGLAESIGVFAIVACLFKKKILKFCVFMFLAVLFQRTSIIMFALLFLFWYSLKFNLLRYKIILLGVFLGTIIFISANFGYYLELLGYMDKYSGYFDGLPWDTDERFNFFSMLVYIPIVALIFDRRKYLFTEFKEFNFLSYTLIFTILTPFLALLGSFYMRRIGMYFYLFVPLIVAMTMSEYKLYAKKAYINLFIITYSLLKLFILVKSSEDYLFRSDILKAVI